MARFTKRQGTRPINRFRNKNRPRIKIGASVKRTKQIAKKTVLSMTENKNFNVVKEGMLTPKPGNASTVSGGTGITVIGYAINSGRIGAGATLLDYGYNGVAEASVNPLFMNRVFRTPTDVEKKPYDLDGKHCRPNTGSCNWIVQRRYVDTTATGNKSLPMFVRMIRVKPKALRYQDQTPDPKNDMFLDQYGNATGVNQVAFKKEQLQTCSINRRRYTVLQDSKMLLTAPMNTNLFDQSGTTNNDTTQNTNASSGQRKFRTVHKMPKDLYYSASNSDSPIAGSNEFVFWHFTLIGSLDDPSPTELTANYVSVFARPVATFKEL